MPAIHLTELQRASLARRTVKFSGSYVVRAYDRGPWNMCPPSEESLARIKKSYDALFVRLTRRLAYGGRKGRSAQKKLLRWWGPKGLQEAKARAAEARQNTASQLTKDT